MARYRAYIVLAVGVLLILIGLLQGDTADWVQAVQIVAGLILLVDGATSLGRESGSKDR
jgi:type IV secretory pathway VirB2 component (pilin)